jgi:hypothetical protein
VNGEPRLTCQNCGSLGRPPGPLIKLHAVLTCPGCGGPMMQWISITEVSVRG